MTRVLLLVVWIKSIQVGIESLFDILGNFLLVTRLTNVGKILIWVDKAIFQQNSWPSDIFDDQVWHGFIATVLQWQVIEWAV